MVRELADVLERCDQENPYLGSARGQAIRAQMQRAGRSLPPDMRWQMNDALGQQSMALGDIEDAVRSYQINLNGIGRLPAEKQEARHIETLIHLAVAYLRKGETENCIALHTSQSCIFPIEGTGVHQDQRGSRAAIDLLKQALRKTKEGSQPHLLARWLLNVAAMTVGEYPSGVPKRFRIPAEAFVKTEGFPRFVEIAPELGLNTSNLSGGSIIDDLDGDGDLDLFNSTWDPAESPHLFLREDDGTFTDRSDSCGLDGIHGGLNMIQGDVDGDGDLDVLVLRGAWMRQFGQHPNSLLRNNGDGTFTDVTFESGLGEVFRPTQTAAFADYDLDGDLDLYIGNETNEGTSFPCQLFQNAGDGTFTDVAETAGVTNLRWTKGVSWGDFDDDRDPDLYVSNMKGENRLYRNNGDGTFTDIAPELGLLGPFESFPCWWWDFDNDGHLDLFAAAYIEEVWSVCADYLGLDPQVEVPALYRNNGDGTFTDIARVRGIDRVTATMGANFGDLDGDGYLDFYLGTGYPDYSALMPNLMFQNLGGESFRDVTFAGGFGHLQKGHAISFADLDQDGDVDVFEQMGGAFRGDGFGNALFENPGFGNSSITVRLVGTTSNTYGIGSRLHARFVEGDVERSVHRVLCSGGSFGANPLRETIGIGKADQVQTLEVHWPASDLRQRFENIPAGSLVTITEGVAEPSVVPLPPMPFVRGGH